MPIYRGEGGSGESSTNALANEVAQDAADAANSASQAATSATAAANSATAAANSATAAAASETAAETAETNAETSETNAAASAAAAATSETNASTSETNAATSETNAATSASNASTSETNASASATAAATSASNAATSETNAATSATNAATSETNAATSASQAATSATSAATSASDAATSYDNFDDRYLGEKTSDPSVDNDGDALITGALYFNSTAGEMRVWDGSVWEAAYLPGSAYLQLAGGTMTGTLTLNADPSNSLEAATKQYVDGIAAAGIHYHDPVRVESDVNLNATYNNGSSGVGATLTNAGTQAALVIDGVTVSLNDRVLVYAQTNGFENGVYTVTDTGSASTNWVLTRATDADSYSPSDPDQFGEGDSFFVQEGNTGAGELYVMTTSGAITFGTTDIHFSQISSAQIYNAGTGIGISGNVISNTGLLTTGSTATDLAITSADINGGNIDGTIIGATTPAAATFATFTSNGIDDNASTTAITIDSNNKVGINATSPGAPLHVQVGASTVGSFSPYTLLGLSSSQLTTFEINTDASSSGYVRFNDQNGFAGTISYSHPTDEMSFWTAGTTRMTLDADGLVMSGANISSSQNGFNPTTGAWATGAAFIGTSSYGGGLSLVDGTAGWCFFADTSGANLRIAQGSTSGGLTTKMSLDSNNNVGIGTSQPSSTLHVHSPGGGATLRVTNNTTGQASSDGFHIGTDSNGGAYLVQNEAQPMLFYTSNIERMRIDASGDITFDHGRGDVYFENNANDNQSGAGTTLRTSSNPASGSESASPGSIFAVKSSGQASRLWVGQSVTSTGSNSFETTSISATGNITAYASDKRLKKDFEVIPNALDKVMQISGYTFKWNDLTQEVGFTAVKPDQKDIGVIAQEVQAIIPEVVDRAPFDSYEDTDGVRKSKSGDDYLTVQYEKIVPLLIEAIKEQQQQIEELKEMISGATN